MKKRIISFLTLMAMLLSMLPGNVLAVAMEEPEKELPPASTQVIHRLTRLHPDTLGHSARVFYEPADASFILYTKADVSGILIVEYLEHAPVFVQK